MSAANELPRKPFYMLSNDDGVHAPGIRVLAEHLRARARVMIVAPHLERSGSSSAITLYAPILIEEVEEDVFGIVGSPADSMMIGLQALSAVRPDWVISGINRGGNLGTDTIYSGTVGAAIEGCINGVPSIAVSVEGREPIQYETAAMVVEKLLEIAELPDLCKQAQCLLNVNVPNIPFSELKGIVTASVGKRIYSDFAERRFDPRGRPYYWLGPGATGHVDLPGSDLVAIHNGYATVSALVPDLYDRAATEKVASLIATL